MDACVGTHLFVCGVVRRAAPAPVYSVGTGLEWTRVHRKEQAILGLKPEIEITSTTMIPGI